MKLSVYDRIAILSILPTKGNMEDMKTTKRLRGELEFTPAERDAIDLTTRPNGDVSWNPTVVMEKEVSLSLADRSSICARLRYLDSQASLTEAHVDIWNRFIEPKPTPTPTQED